MADEAENAKVDVGATAALQIAIEEPRKGTQVWAMIVSGLYLLGLLIYAGCKGTLFTIPLNELGDFLAGAFAPLAFLWLALGFFQQGEELRNSVKALLLQQDELRKSVEQQTALVGVSREQVDLEKSFRQRTEKEESERQKREEERMAPEFYLRLGEGEKGGNYLVQDVIITNMGGDLRKVRIVGDRINTVEHSFFVHSEESTVTINTNSFIATCWISISYVDWKGTIGQQVFTLKPRQVSAFEFVFDIERTSQAEIDRILT